jgi:hypothetical protein
MLLVSFAPHSADVKIMAYGSYVRCVAELFTEQSVDSMSANRVCVLQLCTGASLIPL